MSYPNNTEVNYRYNTLGRLNELNIHSNDYSFNDINFSYDYDRKGNITRIDKNKNPYGIYQYDNLNRLINEIAFDGTEFTYEYDRNGNRTRLLQSGERGTVYNYYPGSNKISEVSGVTYSYDGNGNVISREQGSYDNDYFRYDYRNLVTEYISTSSEIPEPIGRVSVKGIVGGKGSTQPIVKRETYEYKYNSSGKRIAKKDLQTGEETYYIYNGDEVLAEIDGSTGDIKKTYLHIMNKKVYEYDMETRQSSYIYTDHLGSVRMISDEGGRSIWEADYYAFGQQFATRSRESRFNYGFTGKEFDPESGLNYHGARFLDSKIGRFLQVDPLFAKYPTSSQFHYCLNNPLKSIDPNGEDVIFLDDDNALVIDGHCAVLIGDDDEGWKLYSFNGSEEKLVAGAEYDSLGAFQNSSEQKTQRYNIGVRFTASKSTDQAMIKTAEENINNEYSIDDYNCADFAYDVLETYEKKTNGFELKNKKDYQRTFWTSPNNLLKNLRKQDKGKIVVLPKPYYKYPKTHSNPCNYKQYIHR